MDCPMILVIARCGTHYSSLSMRTLHTRCHVRYFIECHAPHYSKRVSKTWSYTTSVWQKPDHKSLLLFIFTSCTYVYASGRMTYICWKIIPDKAQFGMVFYINNCCSHWQVRFSQIYQRIYLGQSCEAWSRDQYFDGWLWFSLYAIFTYHTYSRLVGTLQIFLCILTVATSYVERQARSEEAIAFFRRCWAVYSAFCACKSRTKAWLLLWAHVRYIESSLMLCPRKLKVSISMILYHRAAQRHACVRGFSRRGPECAEFWTHVSSCIPWDSHGNAQTKTYNDHAPLMLLAIIRCCPKRLLVPASGHFYGFERILKNLGY